jgi:error-prone DNA polymerase
MAMLPRLKPANYYDLVIEISIVRPGPITGGMVHPYLRRRSGEEAVVYPHPCLEPVLEKTLGVPLFQEQVIRLAMEAADYTPGEADQLRRDMAAWRRTGRIERHRQRLIQRMTAKGIEPEFAERVFQQIRGFGEYGFPESHAASFALIAYATAWMKCHHPDSFTCALLNAQPMGFYSPSTIVEDAKRHGVEIRPVDVTLSDWNCTLEPREGRSPLAIRMGLRYVKGLGEKDWERIVTARRTREFGSVGDFVERTGLDEGTITRLAEAGALRRFDRSRRSAIWRVRGRTRAPRASLEMTDGERRPRFRPLGAVETINWDYRTSRHSSRGHPLVALRRELLDRGLPTAKVVNAMKDGKRVRYAGMVICRQRPGTASGVVFMTLEDETGFVNVVVWSRVYEKHAVLIKTTAFLGVTGKLQVQDGVVHLIADSFWVPEIEARPASGGSHDFH